MLVSLLSSTRMGRAVALILVAGAALCATYLIGFNDGSAKASNAAEVAALRSSLQAAYQDLNAQRVATERSRLAAEVNGRAAKEAQERINDYEAEIRARGADARCLIGDDDLNWLRQHGAGSDHAAPARR